ncbi:ABC transporter permease [Paenibacillus sp. 1011MAR3C5]|uniref:ABC transporter permease n=1 Tax=Paenibacillus sp. 1011MAR3C5 TaxID=1675787 RepID=UPI000E6BA5F2|nr:ABC transporter permease [Paenibacillus sp. 1011MAR3C5]RJE86909.1 ABC transporter permease [Paenibacillus sp. 1011MAR3C5]
MRKWTKTSEFYVAIIILVLFAAIGSQNGAFFSSANMFDLIRSSIVPGIFVICTMMVIISGGIDVSFPAIATFSMFSATKIILLLGFDVPVFAAFLLAGIIGLGLGLINGLLIAFFKLPTLIVTLGTSSMFSGFLLTFVGSRQISNLPAPLEQFGKTQVIKFMTDAGITVGLPMSVLITAAVIIVVAIMMKYTMIGRGIYALGGDPVSAERVGFNTKFLQCFVYGFVGFLAGIAGMIQTTMMRSSNPVDLLGTELLIIAAVVLGGVRITGGHGTVIGALLGLLLIVTIQNSLILVGIPSYWQRFVIGALILIGTGIAAYQIKRSSSSQSSILT